VWSIPRPGRFTLGKETRYPFYRRLGRVDGRIIIKWIFEKWDGRHRFD
jgi:hypothetical protein